MAGININALPPVVTPAMSDVFPIDQGSTTYQVSNTQMLSLYQTNATGTWNINISGNAATATSATTATTATTATNANNLLVTQVATNASFFPLFVGSSVTGNQAVDLGTGITFNPSTNTLTTTTFVGALTGNATSATTTTTATNATNTAITDDTTTNATMYPTWVTTTTGNLPHKVSSTKLTFNPSTSTLTATNFAGNATTATSATSATTATNATNAANVGTIATSTNASFFPLFVSSSTNGNQIPNLGTGLSFNPSTNNLSTTTFTGALVGNASTATSATSATTATTATNANNVATTQVSTNASFFPLFVASSTNGNQAADLGTGLIFNPSTNNLSTTTFTGALSGNATTSTTSTTATNATNVGITDDTTTNATMYPTWVTTTSGNLPEKISSSKLTFNPSTGVLTPVSIAPSAQAAALNMNTHQINNVSNGVASSDAATVGQLTNGTVTSVATGGLATGGTITTTGTVTVTAAVQSDMETATSTTTAVVPGVVKYHPGVIKGWAQATTGTTATTSYNVSSITDGGTGIATVNWTTGLSSSNGCHLAAPYLSASVVSIRVTSIGASTTQVVVTSVGTTPAVVDPTNYMVALLGDF
jgi:hypothetical protein